jgi:undecaprenyl-diphosphatase
MTLLEALMLGVVQGLTEFLPVSSSGHLTLGKHLLDVQEPDLLFDLVLHAGTLLSVCAFYRADIASVLRGMLQGARRALKQEPGPLFEPEGMRIALLVLLATIPTGVLGILLKRVMEPKQGPSPFTFEVVCALLVLNGCMMMANRWLARRERGDTTRTSPLSIWNIAPLQALLIGLGQGIAVLPGISRSGTTITLALALGIERAHAARYSFLLSIPAIVGAVVLKLKDVLAGDSTFHALPFLIGALAAALVGYACLILLTRLLERAQLHHFAWYCWAVGLGGLAWHLLK